MKRIIKFFFFLAIILLGAAIVLPLVFKDSLIDKLKLEINKQVNARVDFKDAQLSLLSSFPYFGLSLEGFSIDGVAEFDSIRLVEIGELDISIDFMSVISGEQFQIEEVNLKDVDLNLFINKLGKANFDIVKTSETAVDTGSAGEPTSFKIALQTYSLANFNLVYNDQEGQIYTKLSNLNHQGSGDFTANIVNLQTHTTVESFIFKLEDIAYADRLQLESDFNVSLNQEEFKFTFGDNYLKANELMLQFTGWLAMPEETIDMDMNFLAPEANFKQLLSLIPAFFYQDFESVKTQGDFKLVGAIKGQYDGINEKYPAFDFALNLRDASFRYPDLPAGVEAINMDLSLINTNGNLDDTELNVPIFSATILDNVFRANAALSSPISDPTYQFGVNSNFDLAAVEKAIPLEGYILKGMLKADLQSAGKMSYIDNEQYDKIIAQGEIELSNFQASGDSLDFPIDIPFGLLSLNPRTALLKDTKIIIGRSDMTLNGDLDNIMAYALSDSLLSGNLSLTSHYLNIGDFTGTDKSTASEAPLSDTAAMEVVRLPENIDFDLTAEIDSLIYDDIIITKAKGELTLSQGQAQLRDFKMNLLEGQLAISGTYDSKPIEPAVSFDFAIKDFSFKESFKKLSIIQEMVPIMKNTEGKYSTRFSWTSNLLQDMSPDLATANAAGNLNTSPLTITGKTFGQIATFLNNPQYNSLDIGPVALSFAIENGRLEVDPFDFNLGKYKVEASGSSGLDQSLNFSLDMNIPAADLKAASLLKQFGSSITTIPLKVKIGGTLTDPEVRPSFGDMGSQIMDGLKNTLNDRVQGLKTEAKETVNNKLEEFVKAAELQGDKLIAEAEAQAQNLKNEAAKQAQNLRTAGERAAQKILNEAGNNPLKKAVAGPLADKAKSEANSKAQLLEQQAKEQGDKLIDEAKKKKVKLIEDARAKAQV